MGVIIRTTVSIRALCAHGYKFTNAYTVYAYFLQRGVAFCLGICMCAEKAKKNTFLKWNCRYFCKMQNFYCTGKDGIQYNSPT